MSESSRKLESVSESSAPKNVYIDPLESSRGGVAGWLETILRRFKTLAHLALIIPVYAVFCLLLGAAIAPGLAVFDWISSIATSNAGLHYFLLGTAAAAAYVTYGFSLLVLVPLVNTIARVRLRAWRGPYYSLEAVRWYLHNGLTYVARYTFLEFVTPTPFNQLFYRGMGMRIGRGSTINSTCISDPSLLTLGSKVTIGGSVTLIAHYGQGGFLVLAPTRIGDRVTIGLKATIMGGVTIGDDAKVLPNSVVLPKTVIPAGETWGGVPARKR